MNFDRIILIVIDGCGVGALPDADKYNDSGAATIPNCAENVGGISLPTLQSLGLGNITKIKGIPPAASPLASYGKLNEQSPGKDSTTGHWEIAGLVLDKPFPTYPNGFPQEIIDEFEQKADIKTIWNKTANGVEIINRLGEQHMKTKEIILYTSADSVFQLAAHEDVIPLERQYEICQVAREILRSEHAVGRVIARPFTGKPGNFRRTANRKDFSVKPFKPTILDLMLDNNIKTFGIGKINDLFTGCGISEYIKTKSNENGLEQIIDSLKTKSDFQLLFANLIEFDQNFGHRRDAYGFADALSEFDYYLAKILKSLSENDLLVITADHGCDPTFENHTDHTREYTPLIVFNSKLKSVDLSVRNTFADIAQTIADNFKISNNLAGTSFLKELSI
ncbi:MAG: phosphopentomutase [Calditrichaeota bacterium]|nr:MAG: phosphopentomutase [Calditrichota bacterium]